MDMHNDKASNARKHTELSLALAAQFRAEMGVARLSTRALAQKSGVPERTLARLISGDRTIDVAQMDKLCRALGLSIATMLERANARAAAAHSGPTDRSNVAGG